MNSKQLANTDRNNIEVAGIGTYVNHGIENQKDIEIDLTGSGYFYMELNEFEKEIEDKENFIIVNENVFTSHGRLLLNYSAREVKIPLWIKGKKHFTKEIKIFEKRITKNKHLKITDGDDFIFLRNGSYRLHKEKVYVPVWYAKDKQLLNWAYERKLLTTDLEPVEKELKTQEIYNAVESSDPFDWTYRPQNKKVKRERKIFKPNDKGEFRTIEINSDHLDNLNFEKLNSDEWFCIYRDVETKAYYESMKKKIILLRVDEELLKYENGSLKLFEIYEIKDKTIENKIQFGKNEFLTLYKIYLDYCKIGYEIKFNQKTQNIEIYRPLQVKDFKMKEHFFKNYKMLFRKDPECNVPDLNDDNFGGDNYNTPEICFEKYSEELQLAFNNYEAMKKKLQIHLDNHMTYQKVMNLKLCEITLTPLPKDNLKSQLIIRALINNHKNKQVEKERNHYLN